MTITATTSKAITADTLKAVRSHARMSVALVLALQSFTDDKATLNTDKKLERATNASATIGAKMLALKNTLPSDPGKLRMYVESIKQKVNAIVESLTVDKSSFSNHCMRSAITKQSTVALENCDLFIAEYKEMKGTAATVSAKVA
jgi:hypothetical protein